MFHNPFGRFCWVGATYGCGHMNMYKGECGDSPLDTAGITCFDGPNLPRPSVHRGSESWHVSYSRSISFRTRMGRSSITPAWPVNVRGIEINYVPSSIKESIAAADRRRSACRSGRLLQRSDELTEGHSLDPATLDVGGGTQDTNRPSCRGFRSVYRSNRCPIRLADSVLDERSSPTVIPRSDILNGSSTTNGRSYSGCSVNLRIFLKRSSFRLRKRSVHRTSSLVR